MTGNACARCKRSITSGYDTQPKRTVAGIIVSMHPDCARQHDEATRPPTDWAKVKRQEHASFHGQRPEEGCTRCYCGSKYWDKRTVSFLGQRWFCASCDEMWDGTDQS